MFTIGILIPHYNDLAGLRKTLLSLDYSQNIIVLIVDDGSEASQYPGESYILSLIGIDPQKIRVDSLGQNFGIETALNRGLDVLEKEVKTQYIMRIDSGDLCTNNRIQLQLDYLNNHSEVCLVGSQVEYVDESGKYLFSLKLPLSHANIERYSHKAVPFIHSAIMFRTSALSKVGRYSMDYPAAEDYALFLEFVKKCTTANLPQTLVKVEWNTKGISVVKRKRQLRSRLKLLIENAKFDFNSAYGIIRLLLIIVTPLPILQFIKTSVRK